MSTTFGCLPARTSTAFDPAQYDLANDEPLRVGFGAHDYFNGSMCDVRMYRRALTETEIAGLCGPAFLR